MCVRSLGWLDPLEEEMATCSNILAWKIPWTEEPGGLQSMRSPRAGQTEQLTHTYREHNEAPSLIQNTEFIPVFIPQTLIPSCNLFIICC